MLRVGQSRVWACESVRCGCVCGAWASVCVVCVDELGVCVCGV